jgi:anti-anti-sigma factor
MANLKYNSKAHLLEGTFNGKLDTVLSLDIQPLIKKEIEKCIRAKPDEKLKVDFDFKNVAFITSTFIRICVASAKTVGKENFSISNTNPLIKKTLKIAGLDEELNVS